MGLEVAQVVRLIQRGGTQVQTRAVGVGNDQMEAILKALGTDGGSHHSLVALDKVDFVTGLVGLFRVELLVACILEHLLALGGDLALGLACIQKRHIFLAVGFHLLQLRRVHTVKAVFTAAQQLFLQCFVAIRHSILLRDCR